MGLPKAQQLTSCRSPRNASTRACTRMVRDVVTQWWTWQRRSQSTAMNGTWRLTSCVFRRRHPDACLMPACVTSRQHTSMRLQPAAPLAAKNVVARLHRSSASQYSRAAAMSSRNVLSSSRCRDHIMGMRQCGARLVREDMAPALHTEESQAQARQNSTRCPDPDYDPDCVPTQTRPAITLHLLSLLEPTPDSISQMFASQSPPPYNLLSRSAGTRAGSHNR